MCEHCHPQRSWRRPVPPGWALLFALAFGAACWGTIALVVWALWPVSAWIGLSLLAGVVVCNVSVWR